MKKQVSAIGLGALLTGVSFGFAQQQLPATCITDAAMEQRFAAEPGSRERYEAAQRQLQADFNELRYGNTAGKAAAVEYTIPVVFHILHQGGPENISDAACQAAIDQINRDMAREGADTSQIFAPFKSLYIDSDIKFMLAKKDINGNCFNGVVHHIDPKTIWYQSLAQTNSSYWSYTWDPTRYLNIYVVSFIVPNSPIAGGGVAGYTYKPGTWPTGNAHDAIVFTYNTLLPNAAGYQPRALTHETGHWLNLSHTFGNTNNPGTACGDDGLQDTPVTKGNYNACPASTTNTSIFCANNLSIYYQNVENIMDYSNCPKNFTTDQTNAMRASLASGVSGRSNLVTPANLGVNSTDVNGLGICAPVADFMSVTKSYTICLNNSLTFKDFSYNGTVTARQWAADMNAVVASPTASQTSILFNTVGVTNVSLTVSNAQGSDTEVRQVTVIDASGASAAPVMESFELGLPNGWSIYNPSGGTWQQTSMASYDALNSFMINGSASAGGDVDILELPLLNLQTMVNPAFTFAYSYARKTSTHNDVFRLQMSSNCGGSWTDVVSFGAASMVSQTGGGVTQIPYYPLTPSEWAVVDVTTYPNWQNFLGSPHVQMRFVFEEGDAGQGNNFFLDAINISGITGVNELVKKTGMNLYPNPANGVTSLRFNVTEPTEVSLSVVDVIGREVIPASASTYDAGAHTVEINKNDALPAGIYFVNVSLNGTKVSKKLVIE